MTDRVRIITVLLEQDTRVDDATELANAIARFGGVAGVSIGPPVDHNDWVVRVEFRQRFGRQVLDWMSDKVPIGGGT